MTPLVHAEQAVLGAVFLDPGQLGRLADWLRPEHFERPVHAALYAAMLKLRSQDHPATNSAGDGPVPLAWVTDTVQEATHHVPGLTAVFPHLLVSACPRPENAPVYGRMVLEGAIHRSVALHADRLHQAALTDRRNGTAEETAHHAQVLSDVLAELAHRWGTDPRPVSPPDSVAPQFVPPQPVADQALANEEFLLGCLASRPDQLMDVVRWLRPDDFAEPGHQQIYRALGALHHRGEPIDQLTVLWEAQRRGALVDNTLDAERVRHLCDPLAGGGAAEYVGEQLVTASLARTATSAAQQVRALAVQEALAPGQLIGYALHALGPLDDLRRRWCIARGTEPGSALSDQRASPTSAQVEAARSRSLPHRPDTDCPPPPAPATRHLARPAHRSVPS
ncbi:DnaB-like helicase N-terminal domain-containing protein [Streptomyces sp. SDT5-1]|uniref:DnaB-like helicase N-terminal domain-containing protein n=1 Tax=Streptomyces sp. SDT5-1 TaxID=3406418 RepID=UPI003FD39359